MRKRRDSWKWLQLWGRRVQKAADLAPWESPLVGKALTRERKSTKLSLRKLVRESLVSFHSLLRGILSCVARPQSNSTCCGRTRSSCRASAFWIAYIVTILRWVITEEGSPVPPSVAHMIATGVLSADCSQTNWDSFVWCRCSDPPRLGREGEWVFISRQDQLAEEVVCTLLNRERPPPSILQVCSCVCGQQNVVFFFSWHLTVESSIDVCFTCVSNVMLIRCLCGSAVMFWFHMFPCKAFVCVLCTIHSWRNPGDFAPAGYVVLNILCECSIHYHTCIHTCRHVYTHAHTAWKLVQCLKLNTFLCSHCWPLLQTTQGR